MQTLEVMQQLRKPIIKAVLWDLDGAHQTSHGDEEGANYQADRHTVATIFPGVEISLEDTWPFVGRHHSIYRGGMVKLGFERAFPGQDLSADQAAEWLKQFGKIKNQFFVDHPEVLRPRTNADKLAEYFYQIGNVQGMASHSPNDKVQFALKQIKTAEFFAGAYSIDDFNCPKKEDSPEVWIRTLEIIAPGVKPYECLIIDDNDPNVIQAAAAGFNFVHCPDIPRQTEGENVEVLKRGVMQGTGVMMERNAPFDLELLKRTFNFVRTPANNLGHKAVPIGGGAQ